MLFHGILYASTIFYMYSWIWMIRSLLLSAPKFGFLQLRFKLGEGMAGHGRSVLLRYPKRSTCPGSWSPVCQWPVHPNPWTSWEIEEITVDLWQPEIIQWQSQQGTNVSRCLKHSQFQECNFSTFIVHRFILLFSSICWTSPRFWALLQLELLKSPCILSTNSFSGLDLPLRARHPKKKQ